MIKINNKKQLEIFLKHVAKNATNQAKKTLFESPDPMIDNFRSSLRSEMENLKEQEGDEEEKPEEDPQDAETDSASQDTKPEEPKKKSNPAAEKALNLIDYDKGFDISFENIVTALNTLRAGKSTKNKKIKTELNDYYERLSEDERGVLLLYLNELSKVLTGAVEGEDAQDPSEPSTYFNIRKRDSSEPDPDAVDPKEPESNVASKEKTQSGKTAPDQSGGEEDTTPPIKVNESQDLSKVYKKFKKINS